MFKIVSRSVLAQNCKEFVVYAPLVAAKAQPGQFVVIRVDDTGERIPLTIADFDRKQGFITLVTQEVGKTTKKLGLLQTGDSILDLLGPLGHPSIIEKMENTVVFIGGGLGVAPIYPIAKAFREAGNRVIGIVGARTKDLLIWEDKMRTAVDELYIVTDDGSYHRHGVVTDILVEISEKGEKISQVTSIGPVPMMDATCHTTRLLGVPTIVSLNPIMLDGTGMCGACRVSVGGVTRFVCVDGPEFDGHQVDFKELRIRQRMYLDEEKHSLDLFLEKCEHC